MGPTISRRRAGSMPVHVFNPCVGAKNRRHPLLMGIPISKPFTPAFIAMSRLSIASSASGGTRETRERLEFCAKHHIAADIELVKMSEINEVLERLRKGEGKHRLWIEIARDFRWTGEGHW